MIEWDDHIYEDEIQDKKLLFTQDYIQYLHIRQLNKLLNLHASIILQE